MSHPSVSITLKNIASSCNVSESTVSLAINKPYKISKQVREQIYYQIKTQGYNKILNKFQHLGLLIPNYPTMYQNEFYNDVIYGAIRKAAKHNLQLRILDNFDMDYSEIYDIQGILTIGKTPDKYYDRALKYSIPILNCGHPSATQTEIPSIYIERIAATKMMAEFVLNCGHRRIAVLLGDTPNEVIQQEFLQAIAQTIPTFDPQLVFQADYDNLQTIEIAWNKIISQNPKVTAIMCVNDLTAYYLYMMARKYNKRIPDDISITGFDGIHLPRFFEPPMPTLTTAYVDRIALGEQSVEFMKNNFLELLSKTHLTIKISANLLIGNSVARIS